MLIGYISIKTHSLPEAGGILDQKYGNLKKLEKVLQAFDQAKADESEKEASKQRSLAKKAAIEEDESKRTPTNR